MRTLFIVLGVACALHAQEPEAGAATFRTGVADVRVDAQVVDGKNVITGLSQADFTITDEGRPQNVVYFGRDSEPLSLVLLLDISGSMQRWIERISAVAREALGYLRPGDRVALLVFGKRMEVHQDFSDNLAESARQISSVVQNHDVGAGTAINVSIAAAADYMKKNVRPEGRRAILILTDNLSLSYQFADQQVVRSLYGSDTVLNAIVVGRGIRPGPPKPGQYYNPDFTPADVFKLAEETGGEAVRADRPEVSFSEIIERIRTRYSLAYHAPQDTVPGAFRHIGVTLSPDARRRYPLAEVRARHGYYVSD
ncbi:MAG: VWA domain-containing protein [Acidobacteriota bacterium]|nr:VWA domain-containing protein [Acidobacteriota bacterium]